ncbi:MAG TPA: lamin tail domain-containing protein [Mycobacteriales bacterium]|nr:lamin tail domain-containing protein [Mycobacteriales bacterium]
MSIPRRLTPVLAALAAAVLGSSLATAGATAASAASGTPTGSTTLHHCYGKVRQVDDGDTVTVKLTSGCFSFAKGQSIIVRNAAIQATEIRHGSTPGQCWGNQAMRRVEKLLPVGHRVRLTSYRLTKSNEPDAAGHTRYIFYVDLARPSTNGGPWYDLQKDELLHGLVLWKQENVEVSRLTRYLRYAQQAMHAGRGMWGNPHKCGSTSYAGAVQPSMLQAWINYKTDGADSATNANDEFFAVRNTSGSTIKLGGWRFRDGSHIFGGDRTTYFVLPSGTVLRPGEVLKLFPGSGTDDKANLRFYDRSSRLPYYGNAPAARDSAGALVTTNGAHLQAGPNWPAQSVYLLDPAQNFRAWASYPCLDACSAPNLKITNIDPYHTTESLRVVNESSTAADLTGVVLSYDGLVKQFPAGYRVDGNASVLVRVARHGTDTATELFWPNGSTDHMLRDAGGRIWLRTANDVTIDFGRWGDGGSYRY